MARCSGLVNLGGADLNLNPVGQLSSGYPEGTLSGGASFGILRKQTIMIIEESNLSVAWGKAFLKVLAATGGEVSPLVVVINDLDNAEPPEIPGFRDALDSALKTKGLTCDKVANTIFPLSFWNPEMSRKCLYERYLKSFPFIRRFPGNKYGVYFHRLISFGYDKKAQKRVVNQLEHIISTWKNGNHRRSALQAALFDPYQDHTHQRQRGFPCLQQVAFANIGDKHLQVTGFYATQYIFERAYGNYLGLCRLGHFMAHEMGLTLSKVVCIAALEKLKGTKSSLEIFAREVRTALDRARLDDEKSAND